MDALNKTITTERLTLDVIRECDFDSLMFIIKHPEVSRTYMVPDFQTKDEEQIFFEKIRELSNFSNRFVYGIFLSEELIGIINDTDINGEEIEVGYALNPMYFGHGYMTEALKALIHKLFDCGFTEVFAGAFSDNSSSIRVMRKCGMKKLDKVEQIFYRDKTHDCVFYSLKK